MWAIRARTSSGPASPEAEMQEPGRRLGARHRVQREVESLSIADDERPGPYITAPSGAGYRAGHLLLGAPPGAGGGEKNGVISVCW